MIAKKSSPQRPPRKRKVSGPPPAVIASLAAFYRRNGYIRWQNENRLTAEGWQTYKKGHELRLVATSAEELELLQGLLRRAGFEPGRPFAKGKQFRLPIYGKEAVSRFIELIVEGDAS